MADVTLNFVFLLLSLTLAAMGAAVGAWLQHRSWRHQYQEAFRAEKSKAALVTVERLAELIDRRLHRQRQFLWAIRRGDVDDLKLARQEYAIAINEWMGSLGRTKAELWVAFDRGTTNWFERSVHDKFAKNGRKLEAAYRSTQKSPLGEEESELDRLGKSSYELIHTLLGQIEREDINGLAGKHRITYSNWENLSSSYLLGRLFGLGQ